MVSEALGKFVFSISAISIGRAMPLPEETLNSGGSSNGVSVPAPTDTGLPGGSTARATIVWVRIGMFEFISYSNRVGGFGTLTPAADFAAAEKL